jgi:hypothetical protein
MIQTHLNPAWLDGDRYVELLNQAFPGTWNRAAFDWYLRRTFRGVRPDILVRTSGAELVSGLALIPRQVRVGCDAPVDIAVLSAGGTLPAQRRCGHYAALLRAALERARERAWTALLGFVTEGNSSGRGVRRLGARAVPSFYMTTRTPVWRAAGLRGKRPVSRGADTSPIPAGMRHMRSGMRASFHYEDAADWRAQFVERPGGVHRIRLADDAWAWIETVGATDRLQRLDCPAFKTREHVTALARASESAGRRFFLYSLDAQFAAAMQRRGFAVHRGYFLLLPVDSASADWRRLSEASWCVQSGDRL